MDTSTRRVVIVLVALVSLTSSFVGGIYVGIWRGIPFVSRRAEWSIGIYAGESPFDLASAQSTSVPVLTSEDVTDVQAAFVADPFMLHESKIWYMFFEVLNSSSGHGDIGLATSKDGRKWEYERIVLDEPHHLSYPYVFKWRGELYMIPESGKECKVNLYRATDFPYGWVMVGNMLCGPYADPTIVYHDGRWWLFALRGLGDLTLHYSQRLTGPWIEHARSPLIEGDLNVSRPGGRMIAFEGKIIRFAQDGYPTYGNQVRAFVIDVLTTTDYEEHEVDQSPILKAGGNGWNAAGMHHIDPHRVSENRWVACVDGLQEHLEIGWNR